MEADVIYAIGGGLAFLIGLAVLVPIVQALRR